MQTNSNLTARTFAAGVLASTFLASAPALALEGTAFADALVEAAEQQGVAIGYDSARVEGSNVIVSGMKLGLTEMQEVEGGENMEATVSGDVLFEDVQEFDGGGYKVARVGRENVGQTFSDLGDGPDEVTYAIDRWGIEGLMIAGDSQAPELALARAGLFYDRLFLENMTVDVDGDRFATLENAQSVTEMNGETALFDASMDGFSINMAQFDDPDVVEWVEGTGYSTINANYVSQGEWNTTTGDLSVPTNTLTIENMGSFNLGMALGGYTPAFLESLQEITDQMSSGDPNQAQAAQMQILGLVSQLSFGNFIMRYEDQGGTDRLLEYYAQENGMTRNELVSQTMQTLPLILGQAGVPALQEQITSAVQSFLDNPQSITLSLQPAEPVPFPVLMGAAMSSPVEVVNALNAQVTAND